MRCGTVATVTNEKLERIKSLLRSLESCVVAYSGGVDSVFLAVVAHQELGRRALAVIADSPSLPRHELAEAQAIAKGFGFRLEVVLTEEFEDEEYLSNPATRCYHCKSALFQKLVPFAKQWGFATVVYGENASDSRDYRPGRVAADEFAIRAPLREAGLTKDEIRRLSRAMGLPTAEKPAQPCLSSRVPYGERVTLEKLRLIEAGEAAVRRLGIRDLRVRLHELGQGFLARVEVPRGEWSQFVEREFAENVGPALLKIGFQYVTLDLLGYRRGSLNETVVPSAKRNVPSSQ
ncbi:MAG: hypothetical protein M2R45_01256 [Verrucomicrobia subdivision 3 bacterium]|nr:hypothetical protein [Limisphaerales bacterium]MCS1415127.1 hypothetical protein [Limisphaerales bacterium]